MDHRVMAPQGTPAIDRAAQLLTLVLDSEHPLGVSDLATAAELPKSTASRLVSSLERPGLVRRNGARGKVQAGPAILRFAHRGVVDRNLVELAQAPLDALAARRRETGNLAGPRPTGRGAGARGQPPPPRRPGGATPRRGGRAATSSARASGSGGPSTTT